MHAARVTFVGPSNQPIRMGGTFQKLATVRSSRLQLHHAYESLSLAPPQYQILLVRARTYLVTVQFPQEVVRSDRRARGGAPHGKKYYYRY